LAAANSQSMSSGNPTTNFFAVNNFQVFPIEQQLPQALITNSGVFEAGTAAAPSITTRGDTDTGIYFPAENTLGFATSGSQWMQLGPTGNFGLHASDVDDFTPSDRSTQAQQLKWGRQVGGRRQLLIESSLGSGPLTVNSTFNDASERGLINFYRGIDSVGSIFGNTSGLLQLRAQSSLALLTNALTRLTILSNGNVGVGTTTPSTRFHVNGTIRYTNRPAAGTITTLGFDANGDLKASSSSRKYKHDIKPYENGLETVMQLKPVSFVYNGENDPNIGFIAEDVNDLGLSEVVIYDEKGDPEGVQYANMVSLLTKAIQDLKKELDEVKSELKAIKDSQ